MKAYLVFVVDVKLLPTRDLIGNPLSVEMIYIYQQTLKWSVTAPVAVIVAHEGNYCSPQVRDLRILQVHDEGTDQPNIAVTYIIR